VSRLPLALINFFEEDNCYDLIENDDLFNQGFSNVLGDGHGQSVIKNTNSWKTIGFRGMKQRFLK
jgi:hypothetical protein